MISVRAGGLGRGARRARRRWRAPFAAASTSSLPIRPAGPVPWTRARSTPCAAATRRATGVTFDAVGQLDGGAGVAPRARRARRLAAPAPARPSLRAVAGGHARDDLADGHGLAGLGEDLGRRVPGRGRGHLGVDLVGGDLDDRLVGLDGVAAALAHSRTTPSETDSPIAGMTMSTTSRPRPRPRRLVGAAGGAAARPAWPARCRSPARSRRARRRRATVSPSAAWILTTVPATGAGTSASTLSVEISTSVSSAETGSPSALCHSRTVPSVTESPIAGMTTSTVCVDRHWNRLRPYRVDGAAAGRAFRDDETELPANGPTPPTTATITPSQSGITRRRTASMHSSDMTIQPMPCAQPKTVSAPVEPGHEPDDQQRQVDRRVGEREVLELLEASSRRLQQRGHARAASASASAGQAARVGRPPGVGVVLVVARDLGALGAARPGRSSITMPVGQADERLDREPLGRDGPLLLELARERRRPGPRRPRPRRRRRAPSARPRSRPSRAAAGEPAARRRRAPRTAPRATPSASSREQPQRPAHRLQLDREPAAGGLEAGEPRGEAVVRRRAAVLRARRSRASAAARWLGAGLEAVLAPARRDLVRPARGRGRGCRASRCHARA